MYLEKELYLYRDRINSAMQKFDSRRIDGYILFQRLEKFIITNRPEFAIEFSKYGVSYWVWSTIWQAAVICKDFKAFIETIDFMDISLLKNMLDFPDKKVKVSSQIFLLSKKLYYYLINVYFFIKKEKNG